jgi:hypothetical protein
MWRVLTVTAVAAMCVSCGGGGISSYEDGMAAQVEIMEEMVDVLEGVTDEASAEEAATKIEALGGRIGEVIAQLEELPTPTMEEMQEIAHKYADQGQEFQQRAASQMMKLAEYESLSEAWQRAMANMR